MAANDHIAATRYLAFQVGAQRYALPAQAITEVIRIASLARVPQGPAALLGVTNLRGQVVPVVGSRELLQQGTTPDPVGTLSLVLDHAAPTALVVDSVESLEEIADERVERASPDWQHAQGGERVTGAYRRASTESYTKILDIEALLSGAFAERASPARRERAAPSGMRRDATEQRARALEMLLTFEVGGQEFAFPLTAVEELLPLPESLSAISRADAVILGFTSVRESLIPLLSLRGLLGFEAAPRHTGHEKVLILKVAGAPTGLLVDDARAVVAADTEAMEPVPAVLVARTGGESRIRSVYRGEGGKRLISILSPELLFRDDIMTRLTKVEHHVPSQKNAAPGDIDDEAIFLVFRLGDDEFGLPIGEVVEVAPVPAQVTRVPKAPKFLEGVVNLRGEVLPVVDQRRRFEMPAAEQATRRLVVVKTGALRAGLIVDSVTDVLRTTRASISPPPDLTAQISRLVHGVVNLEAAGRLVLLLDPAELLTRAEQGQLDTFQSQSRKARA